MVENGTFLNAQQFLPLGNSKRWFCNKSKGAVTLFIFNAFVCKSRITQIKAASIIKCYHCLDNDSLVNIWLSNLPSQVFCFTVFVVYRVHNSKFFKKQLLLCNTYIAKSNQLSTSPHIGFNLKNIMESKMQSYSATQTSLIERFEMKHPVNLMVTV